MTKQIKAVLESDTFGWVAALAWILIILIILVSIVGASGGSATTAFLQGAFGGRRLSFLMSTFGLSAIIIGMALSAMLSFRAGLFNIGGEGQLVAGGLVSALVAIYVPAPPLVALLLGILSGMAAGAVWAVLAGLLQLYVGVPLLVGTLMLNFPIRYVASYLVSHPLRDVSTAMTQSMLVPAGTWLPLFPGVRLDIGILIILIVALLSIVYTNTTVHGYQTRLNGLSPDFAKAVGLPVRRLTLQTLAISGAVAGLVGAIAVFGVYHRYIDGMLVQPLYAWTGITAALLVGMIPSLIPFSGFFFAAVETGAGGMERLAGVPKEIGLVMQAVIILFVAGRISGSMLSLSDTTQGGDSGH